MQLQLAFYKRLILWNLIGNHNAKNLKEASVLLRVIEKVRLSGPEQKETEFESVGQQFTWKLPYPGYGEKDLSLDPDEATALTEVLEAAPVRVLDAEWIAPFVEQLKAKEDDKPAEAKQVPVPRKSNGKEARQ